MPWLSFYKDYLQHLLTSFQQGRFCSPHHPTRLDVARRDVAAEMEQFLQLPMDPDVSPSWLQGSRGRKIVQKWDES